jgi:RNA polymerase-associated protein LEO1
MASQVAVEASLNAPSLPNNLSDDDEHDITAKVGPIDSEDEIHEGTPRNTVEENGLDEEEDDDDLFGDGADDKDDTA